MDMYLVASLMLIYTCDVEKVLYSPPLFSSQFIIQVFITNPPLYFYDYLLPVHNDFHYLYMFFLE